MKAHDWSDSLLKDHREAMSMGDGREAYDVLTRVAENLPGYACAPAWQGVVRIFKFTDVASGERPFALIVNRSDILFYVRKAGLRRVPGGLAALRNHFPSARENPAGEWTVRLANGANSAVLARFLFSSRTGRGSRLPSAPIEPPVSSQSQENIVTILKLAAAQVKQGDLTIYTTSVPVRALIATGFYSVETLDPENTSDRGYQRLLNTARARKLCDYILNGLDDRDAFLPTSVFLATDKSLSYDQATHTLLIDTAAVGSFSVVDGQHRLEGLRMAAEKDPRVLDFELPVNIAVELPKIAQMCHFLIVNTTQKSVDKSVEQRIIARLTDALDVEDLPSLPKWIYRSVERGDVDKGVKYVDYLNSAEDSPWKGKIRIANSDSSAGTVNQKTFVKALVKYVLTASNPLTAVRDFEKEKRIFLNYWKSIAQLLDDGGDSVLYKYNGVDLFCKFSSHFFMKLQDKGSFTVKTMTETLKHCFENVEGDYAGVGHPEWWTVGGSASFLNAGAINQASRALSIALNRQTQVGALEI